MASNEVIKFIRVRRADIRTRGAPLWERKTVLLKEIGEIDPAINMLNDEWKELEKLASAVGVDLNNMPPELEEVSATPSPNLRTIKEAILEVLAKHPEGLESSEILEKINDEFFNGAIVRTSFSPQLSRLKQDDEVSISEGKYILNKRRAPPTFVERRI